MAHQDLQVKPERWDAEYLRVALQWLFVGVGWSVVGFRADCTWTPQWLSSTALLWAWSSEGTLVERFNTARKTALFLGERSDLSHRWHGRPARVSRGCTWAGRPCHGLLFLAARLIGRRGTDGRRRARSRREPLRSPRPRATRSLAQRKSAPHGSSRRCGSGD